LLGINNFEEVTQINMSRELEKLPLRAVSIKRKLILNDSVHEIFGGERGIADSTSGQFATKNLIQSVLRIRKNPHAD
jgi:hypothetical protein